MKDIDEITGDVISVALSIHRDLEPGLLESVYETVLGGKLAQRAIWSIDKSRSTLNSKACASRLHFASI